MLREEERTPPVRRPARREARLLLGADMAGRIDSEGELWIKRSAVRVRLGWKGRGGLTC